MAIEKQANYINTSGNDIWKWPLSLWKDCDFTHEKKKRAKANLNTIFLPTRSTEIQNGVWWYLTKLNVYSYFNLAFHL